MSSEAGVDYLWVGQDKLLYEVCEGALLGRAVRGRVSH